MNRETAAAERRSHKNVGPGTKAVVDIFRIDQGKVVEHWDVLQDVPDTAKNSNTMS
jgi:predicted SnoaL-like aldol condensation-catalyzing enzyme